MSTLKTTFLMALLTVLLVMAGSALGRQNGMVMAFMLALIMNGVSYRFSDKIVLRRHREFDLACVLALAGVRHICLVGHTDCAMESLKDKRQDFVSGLERVAGWSKGKADLQYLY